MREKFKLKVWELIKEQVTVLYRNCFYQAIHTNWWRYIILNSKEQPIDITNKKFIIIPDWISIVNFSLLWHNHKSFRF